MSDNIFDASRGVLTIAELYLWAVKNGCEDHVSNAVLIKPPDYEGRKALRERQLSGQVEGEMSNSKRKRLEKKGRLVAADIDM